MRIEQMRVCHAFRLAAICLVAAGATGCATSSLDRSREGRVFPKNTLPVFLGVSALNDPVRTDDQGIHLRDYLARNRAVTSVELLPPWVDVGQVDADYVLSGSISVPSRSDRSSGWGKFLSVITLSGYYFLGGPTRKTHMTVDYKLTLTQPATGKEIPLSFLDERSGYYGLYGPKIASNSKPEIYEPGWREIYFRLSDLLQEPPP